MEKNNGGSAFPTSNYQKIVPISTGYSEGMTLRDYFAAKAMQSIAEARPNTFIDAIAELAYKLADAMLEARKE